MMADELIPGVHLLPAPCYTINVVGSVAGPDFEGGHSHYPSVPDAAAAVETMQESWDADDLRVLEIVQEEFRCVTAVSSCGVLFVYQDADQSHFVHRQGLLAAMSVWTAVGWQVTPSGVVLCDDTACRTCRPEPSGDPLTIPVPTIPGQLTLATPQES